MDKLNKLLASKPEYWLEIEKNGISGKWLIRLGEYRSGSNFQGRVYLKVGETLEEVIEELNKELYE